jgi:hypothetical protein
MPPASIPQILADNDHLIPVFKGRPGSAHELTAGAVRFIEEFIKGCYFAFLVGKHGKRGGFGLCTKNGRVKGLFDLVDSGGDAFLGMSSRTFCTASALVSQ